MHVDASTVSSAWVSRLACMVLNTSCQCGVRIGHLCMGKPLFCTLHPGTLYSKPRD